jgi:hypothetical protein
VRVTVDLPPTGYAALKRWELEAAVETGQAEVTNQAVLLRALAGRLLTDEQLAESVPQDISNPEPRICWMPELEAPPVRRTRRRCCRLALIDSGSRVGVIGVFEGARGRQGSWAPRSETESTPVL